MVSEQIIRLRERKFDDVVDNYNWQTDPELVQLDAAPPITVTMPQYISFYISELRHPSPKRQTFAIETMDGKHIGNCSYYDINEKMGETQLGIMIGDRDYWNKGYGTETVKALLDLIFENHAFKRVYLKTLLMNVRAQRCFQKCGFSFLKNLKQDHFQFMVMEISREAWQKKQANAIAKGTE